MKKCRKKSYFTYENFCMFIYYMKVIVHKRFPSCVFCPCTKLDKCLPEGTYLSSYFTLQQHHSSQPLQAVLRCVLFSHKGLQPNSIRRRGRKGLRTCVCVCVRLNGCFFQAAVSGSDPSVNHSTARTTTGSIVTAAVTAVFLPSLVSLIHDLC